MAARAGYRFSDGALIDVLVARAVVALVAAAVVAPSLGAVSVVLYVVKLQMVLPELEGVAQLALDAAAVLGLGVGADPWVNTTSEKDIGNIFYMKNH